MSLAEFIKLAEAAKNADELAEAIKKSEPTKKSIICDASEVLDDNYDNRNFEFMLCFSTDDDDPMGYMGCCSNESMLNMAIGLINRVKKDLPNNYVDEVINKYVMGK